MNGCCQLPTGWQKKNIKNKRNQPFKQPNIRKSMKFMSSNCGILSSSPLMFNDHSWKSPSYFVVTRNTTLFFGYLYLKHISKINTIRNWTAMQLKCLMVCVCVLQCNERQRQLHQLNCSHSSLFNESLDSWFLISLHSPKNEERKSHCIVVFVINTIPFRVAVFVYPIPCFQKQQFFSRECRQ